jgi:hypothetical protein
LVKRSAGFEKATTSKLRVLCLVPYDMEGLFAAW